MVHIYVDVSVFSMNCAVFQSYLLFPNPKFFLFIPSKLEEAAFMKSVGRPLKETALRGQNRCSLKGKEMAGLCSRFFIAVQQITL